MKVRTEAVTWGVPGKVIVNGVDAVFADGKVTAVIGPNGSGKTSLLHLIAGLRHPDDGQVWLGEKLIQDYKDRERARRLALVEQHPSTELELSVRQIVGLGRIPYLGSWPGKRDRDAEAVPEAMEIAGVTHLESRTWTTLSGGEKQRVHLARALAQRPKILLLDEPTNHLDLSHQLDFLETVCGLGITTVAVLHDLDLAAAYCEEVLVMNNGKAVAHGKMSDSLSPELIEEVFGVETTVTETDRRRVMWHKPPSASGSVQAKCD